MRSLLRPVGVIAFGLSPAILISACGDGDDETANTPVVPIQETSYVVKEPATTTTTLPADLAAEGGISAEAQVYTVVAGDAVYSIANKFDVDPVEMVDGRFTKVEGTEREIPADLVLLAMGFVGPEQSAWLHQLGVEFDERGNVRRDDEFMSVVPGVFVAGDMGRGQSLIVWAIAEGRACAAAVDRFLVGETTLPAPVLPTTRPLM
jgi:hypothetical protein